MKVRINKIRKKQGNDEWVVLEVLENCNMNHYILFETARDEEGVIPNKPRHMYLFQSLEVHQEDFVCLYTRPRISSDKDSFRNKRGTTTYNLFWGVDTSIWKTEGDKAYLICYDDWETKTFLQE